MSLFEITIQRKDDDAWPVVVRHQPVPIHPAQLHEAYQNGTLDEYTLLLENS
jgi:hypothetical protein